MQTPDSTCQINVNNVKMSKHCTWNLPTHCDDKHHSATITISRFSSETDINIQVRMGEAVETWLGLVMLGENEPGWRRFGEFG